MIALTAFDTTDHGLPLQSQRVDSVDVTPCYQTNWCNFDCAGIIEAVFVSALCQVFGPLPVILRACDREKLKLLAGSLALQNNPVENPFSKLARQIEDGVFLLLDQK